VLNNTALPAQQEWQGVHVNSKIWSGDYVSMDRFQYMRTSNYIISLACKFLNQQGFKNHNENSCAVLFTILDVFYLFIMWIFFYSVLLLAEVLTIEEPLGCKFEDVTVILVHACRME